MKTILTATVLCIVRIAFAQDEYPIEISKTCTVNVKYDSTRSIEILSASRERLKGFSVEEGYFSRPEVITRKNGKFLRILEVYDRKASGHKDYFYRVGPNCKLDTVHIKAASEIWARMLEKGESIREQEVRLIRNDEILFYFGIWKKSDPDCCPSQGYMVGKYDIIKVLENSKFHYEMITDGQQQEKNHP
jgi:hypothetical protein